MESEKKWFIECAIFATHELAMMVKTSTFKSWKKTNKFVCHNYFFKYDPNMRDLQDVGGEITGNKRIHYGFQEFEIINHCWTHMKQTYLLSFDANVASFSLAKSPPRDLQITAYK